MCELTYEELHSQLDYNPLTGIFKWKVSISNIKIGDEAGTKHHSGYIHIGINKKYTKHIDWLGFSSTKNGRFVCLVTNNKAIVYNVIF